jgi:hypothetical protein
MKKMINYNMELAVCKVGENQMKMLIFINLTLGMATHYLQYLMVMEDNKSRNFVKNI